MLRLQREYYDNKVKKLLEFSRDYPYNSHYNPAYRLVKNGYVNENPAFNKAFQDLVVKGLQSPYNLSDTKAALQDLQAAFQDEGMHISVIRRVGRRGAFLEYLRGLPHGLQVPFSYLKEANFLVELTGEKRIFDLDAEEVDFFYWAHVEYAIHTLLKEHGLPAMDSLNILG